MPTAPEGTTLFLVYSGSGLSGLPLGGILVAPRFIGSTTLPAALMLAARRLSVFSATSASVSIAPISAASGLAGAAGIGLAGASTTAVLLLTTSSNLLMYNRPGSFCGSKKNTVWPMTLVLAAASWSIILAWISRDHGQRPKLPMDCSSMAITAMRSEGVLVVAETARS